MLDLNALEVAENSIVYAQDPNTGAWVEYDTFTGETNRIWTPIEQMPQSLQDAVVSVEDRGFLGPSPSASTRCASPAQPSTS